jgi:N-acetylneuraminic acid mutarotase
VLANSQSDVIGGYVYLFGGRTSQTTVTGAIYRAPTSNPSAWVAAGNMPGPVHSGQYYNDGTYLYMFGGRSGETAGDTTYLNTIYRAPVSNPLSWTLAGTLPSKWAYSQLVAPGDGYLYLLGGSPSYEVYSGTIYRAPVSNPLSWSAVGALPTTLTTSQAAVIGSYVYLFGGRTGTGVYVNTIYRAPVSNPLSWTAVGTLPMVLGFSSYVQIGDYIYLLGGYSGSSIQNVLRAPVINPLSWTNWTLQLPAGFDSSSAQVIGSYVYLMSGGQNTTWATQYVYRGTIQ